MNARSVFAVLLCCAAVSAAAQSYVCQDKKGQRVYTTEPGKFQNCRAVERPAVRPGQAAAASAPVLYAKVPADTAETFAVPAASMPAPASVETVRASASEPVGFETLSAIMQQDIEVAPVGEVLPDSVPVGTAGGAIGKPALRQMAQEAKIVAMPPPIPVLTRRQILQKEINQEKNAMKAELGRLNTAISKGDTAAVRRLSALIKDRQSNIASLEAEMRR